MYYRATVYIAYEALDHEGQATGDYEDGGEINRYTAPTLAGVMSLVNGVWRTQDAEIVDDHLEFSSLAVDGQCIEIYTVHFQKCTIDDVSRSAISKAFNSLKAVK